MTEAIAKKKPTLTKAINILSLYFRDAELNMRQALDKEASDYGFDSTSEYIKTILISRKIVIDNPESLVRRQIELTKEKRQS